MSYHTIILVGNLGRDPEMRFTPSGEAVTNFSVAVDATYNDAQGNKVERTLWVRISTWGKQAENCNQYLKKGKKVLVEGTLVFDNATGGPKTFSRQDGTTGAAFEVKANIVRFLSSKSDDDAAGVPSNTSTSTGPGSDDPIPF